MPGVRQTPLHPENSLLAKVSIEEQKCYYHSLNNGSKMKRNSTRKCSDVSIS